MAKEKSAININKYNHSKASLYLKSVEEKLEGADSTWLENAYFKVEEYMQILRDSRSFTEGFDKVMNDYKSTVNDKNNFILIQLLEEFSERFSPNRYYTEKMYTEDFKYVLSLAPEVEQSLLGIISDLGEGNIE